MTVSHLLPSAASVDRLCEFLRFRSISTQSHHASDMQACVKWLHRLLRSSGFTSEIVETPGHPALLAAGPQRPGRPTVLIYGHYDVQPVDPVAQWTSPPFEPTIRQERLYARGATDNKGQILAHILGAADLLRDEGDLPVNVKFLVEGEEEIGSTHLADVLRHRAEALRCDVVAVSDTGMVRHGWPTLTYSLRGIAALELHLTGPDRDLHSGIFGGAVRNPADALARLLASLHDAEGRIAVAGFHDDVVPLADWEREAFAELPVTDDDLLALTGAPALDGERGFSALERIGARPTAEINGLTSGYQGEGTKTVLPATASAKLTFRLVPNQTPAKVLAAVMRHFEERCPGSVRLTMVPGHGGLPYIMDPRGPWGMAARRALEDVFGRAPALLREGGSIPIVQAFRDLLGADTLLLALASPDANAHAPDENFPLENFAAGQALHRALLREIAKVPAVGA